MYTDTGIRSQLNLIFFILSFWSTLTILLPLLVVLPPVSGVLALTRYLTSSSQLSSSSSSFLSLRLVIDPLKSCAPWHSFFLRLLHSSSSLSLLPSLSLPTSGSTFWRRSVSSAGVGGTWTSSGVFRAVVRRTAGMAGLAFSERGSGVQSY